MSRATPLLVFLLGCLSCNSYNGGPPRFPETSPDLTEWFRRSDAAVGGVVVGVSVAGEVPFSDSVGRTVKASAVHITIKATRRITGDVPDTVTFSCLDLPRGQVQFKLVKGCHVQAGDHRVFFLRRDNHDWRVVFDGEPGWIDISQGDLMSARGETGAAVLSDVVVACVVTGRCSRETIGAAIDLTEPLEVARSLNARMGLDVEVRERVCNAFALFLYKWRSCPGELTREEARSVEAHQSELGDYVQRKTRSLVRFSTAPATTECSWLKLFVTHEQESVRLAALDLRSEHCRGAREHD